MKNSHCKSILSNETGKRFTWERRERERERERERLLVDHMGGFTQ